MKFIETPSFKLAIYSKGDKNAEKLALVLPGRLDTKNYVHMTSHVDFLAGLGYYALSFDPPGSWESPGSVENYTTTNYIKAVNELIEYFAKPTLLIGHSRGGTVTILVGVTNLRVTAIVPIMATYGSATSPSQKDIAAGVYTTYRDLPLGASKTGEKKFTLPLSYFKDSQKYNPEVELRKFKGPKLLICATHDKYTNPKKVKEVFDSLSEPKMLLELNTDHNYRYHPDMIKKVNEAMADFLEKYPHRVK